MGEREVYDENKQCRLVADFLGFLEKNTCFTKSVHNIVQDCSFKCRALDFVINYHIFLIILVLYNDNKKSP